MSSLLDTDICSVRLKAPGTLTNRFLTVHGTASCFGRYHGQVPRRGAAYPCFSKTSLGIDDLLNDVKVIGMDLSTALIHGSTLATHNVPDFARIPGLHIVDWLAP